ncbi:MULTISPECIES: zeta toxin family protein [unclassified Lysobacter]|uniref:zeta toxin family protein n=1 Tax=unclassified Lysobacter TaxID=2635362 RepID=UPI001BEC1C09|nr:MULTISPECIES: zeta toxin family protein [unclassified Lysobacter]MBT2746582.1 zeta toxin family protein [Lysobacter sp. ISL-42]MBT2753423.1 zeta toxin family protein [Lysobacter sp. ISL-50]MBT2775533.1 zeta toxin family protein [Lysobacter sp. ISL-54]MBT2782931.1 zeta toxin family protein [Lysobacter sp. ISL-52]
MIFWDRIVPDSGMEQAASHSQPKAIFLVGQPGAGKSALTGMARADLGIDLIMIDPDRLRSYWPDVRELRNASPYTWPLDTDHDVGLWTAALQEVALRGRKNIIIDTALNDAESLLEQIRLLQAEGYEVQVRAVAVHRLESELAVDARFLSGFLRDGHGLYHQATFRKQSYENMPSSLDHVRSQAEIPIRIFNCDGLEIYDGRINPAPPGAALERAREARLTDPKVTKAVHMGLQKQLALHRDLPEILARMTGAPMI